MPGRPYHRRVRIILHAGLHKSGTTSLQVSWNAAYADHPDVWYPRRGGGRPPGHHDLVRPLLRAFGEDGAPDLVAAADMPDRTAGRSNRMQLTTAIPRQQPRTAMETS